VWALHGRDRIDERKCLDRVVDVRRAEDLGEGMADAIDDEVMF
jgi:hypothetical protein